jgi:hypothetical protein
VNAVAEFGPCIRSRVLREEYDSLPGISITRLKELRRSPMHYLYRLTNPKQSDALTLGTATHVAALEPERFESQFMVWQGVTASGRAKPRSGKNWLSFKDAAAKAGQTILTAAEALEARTIARAVRSDPLALAYLEVGDPEVTLQWQVRGRIARGRADWLTKVDGEPVIVGLKTARDARPIQFGNACAKLGYHLQWAFYYDGYEFITGRQARMVEIVVENAPPYAVVVYRIPDDVIQQGRDEYLVLLDQLDECERAGSWPGPSTQEEYLTLPSWVYAAHDDLSELGLE